MEGLVGGGGGSDPTPPIALDSHGADNWLSAWLKDGDLEPLREAVGDADSLPVVDTEALRVPLTEPVGETDREWVGDVEREAEGLGLPLWVGVRERVRAGEAEGVREGVGEVVMEPLGLWLGVGLREEVREAEGWQLWDRVAGGRADLTGGTNIKKIIQILREYISFLNGRLPSVYSDLH